MRATILPATAFLGLLGVFGVLAVLPASEPRVARPAAAASSLGPRILTHTPWIEERGIPASDAGVRIDFGEDLDPASVHEGSIRIGYRDPDYEYRPVPADVSFEGDRTVTLRPREKLRPAIYYEVQVRGGEDGVRARGGLPLSEDYRWRFATQVEFGPAPRDWTSPFRLASLGTGFLDDGAAAVGLKACVKPRRHTLGDPHLIVRIYQPACDAPVIRGKLALIQTYAIWHRLSDVAPDQQVSSFIAEVEARLDGRQRIDSEPFIFHQYGTVPFNRGMRDGSNASLLRWWDPQPIFTNLPGAEVGVRLRPIDGSQTPARIEIPDFSPGRRDILWREFREGRGGLSLHLYVFEFEGAERRNWLHLTPELGAGLMQLIWSTADYVDQIYPVINTYGLFHMATIVVPEDAPGEAFRDNPRGLSLYLHQELRKARDAMQVSARNNVPVGVVPREVFENEGGIGKRGEAIRGVSTLIRPDVGVVTVAHEIGHYHSLRHCPLGANDDFDDPSELFECPIEAYRIDRTKGDGWNKSGSQGNAEADVLLSFMHSTGLSSSIGGDPPEMKFIDQNSYWRLLDVFTQGIPEFRTPTLPGMAPLPDDGFPAARPPVRFASWFPAGAGVGAWPGAPWAWEGDIAPLRPASASQYRAPGAVQDGTTLLVSGFARPDGSRAVIDGARVLAGILEDDGLDDPVPGVAVELTDDAGNVLTRVPLSVFPDPFLHEGDESISADALRPFAVRIPGATGGTRVRVQGSGGTLAGYARSPSAPTVTLLAPGDGAVLDASTEIRWSGSDADGDPLTYEVAYRKGPEDPWLLLLAGTGETSFSTGGLLLHAGPAPEIRVMASDGFNVSAPAVARVEIRRPLHPPAVLPGPESNPVAVNLAPRAVFATELDPGTVHPGSATLEDASGATVSAEVTLDDTGRWVLIQPDQPLRHGSTYTVRLRGGIADRWGNVLAEDHTWSFTTVADDDPPWVVGSTPEPGALTVFQDAEVRVVFSEPLDPASAAPANFRVQGPSGSPVPGTITWDAASLSLVFRPAAPMPLRTRLTVTVEGIRDEAGNVMEESHAFAFTTAGAIVPRRRPDGARP